MYIPSYHKRTSSSPFVDMGRRVCPPEPLQRSQPAAPHRKRAIEETSYISASHSRFITTRRLCPCYARAPLVSLKGVLLTPPATSREAYGSGETAVSNLRLSKGALQSWLEQNFA